MRSGEERPEPKVNEHPAEVESAADAGFGAKEPTEGPKRETGRDFLDWVLISIIGAIIALIIFFLWPRGREAEPPQNPLPVRKIRPPEKGYLSAYRQGLEHLKRKEYGQAVLDFEDAVALNKGYAPAVQKLGVARSLAELDAKVRRGLLSGKAAELRAPQGYLPEDFERKEYELNSISFRRAAEEGAPNGSMVVWWGTVVSTESDGFTLENKKLRQAFFVRSRLSPGIGAELKVYGRLLGRRETSPGATTWYHVPVVQPRFIDPSGSG